MATPFKFDDAIVMCGGAQGQRIQQMLENKFFTIAAARSGSYADREKAYLLAQGARAGSRADMWSSLLSNARPFTDGVPAALPAVATQAFAQDVFATVIVEAASTAVKA